MLEYPYLGRSYVNDKPYVVLFLEENKGVIVVNETGDDNYKFGKYGEFEENSFEFLPQEEVVRIGN